MTFSTLDVDQQITIPHSPRSTIEIFFLPIILIILIFVQPGDVSQRGHKTVLLPGSKEDTSIFRVRIKLLERGQPQSNLRRIHNTPEESKCYNTTNRLMNKSRNNEKGLAEQKKEVKKAKSVHFSLLKVAEQTDLKQTYCIPQSKAGRLDTEEKKSTERRVQGARKVKKRHSVRKKKKKIHSTELKSREKGSIW